VYVKSSLGLSQPKLFEPVLPQAEVMTELVHDRDLHFTRNGLGRGTCPLQRPAKNGDSVWRNQVVLPTSLGERHPLIQAEQGILIPCGGTIEPGCGTSESNLVSGRLVLNDHVHVIEHGRDLGWEVIQRTGDDPFKPLLPRVLDTVPNPVLHTANDTSFGVIAPIYGEQSGVRTPVFPQWNSIISLAFTQLLRNWRYTACYDQ
jgi:hypothetical protein